MTSNELIYVTTIAKFGSIGKAAKILGMNQSSLRRCLQNIEDELSINLFNRTAAGLFLTEAGSRYIYMANDTLRLYRNMQEEIYNETQLLSGKISIGIEQNYNQGILPYVLPKFKTSYPNIIFEIIEANSDSLSEMILTGKLDLAIIHLPTFPYDLEYTVLFEEPLVLITEKNNELPKEIFTLDETGKEIINLKKIKDPKFILQQMPNKLRSKCNKMFIMIDFNPDIVIEIQNLENARRLAGMGIGYTILPISYVNADDLRFETSFFYLNKQLDPNWTTVVTYANKNTLSKAANEFLQMLIEISATIK